MSRYFGVFVFGSLAGIVNEFIHKKGSEITNLNDPKTLVSATVANLYGWTALACVYFFDSVPGLGMPLSVLVGTLIAVSIEAVGGVLSEKFHGGKRSWTYPQSWIPFFGGSVSVISSLYFSFLILALYVMFK